MQQPAFLWQVASACLGPSFPSREEGERAAAALAACSRAAADSAGEVVRRAAGSGALRCLQWHAVRRFLRHLVALGKAEVAAGTWPDDDEEHRMVVAGSGCYIVEIDRTFMPPLISSDDEAGPGAGTPPPEPLAMVGVWVKHLDGPRLKSSHACFFHDDVYETADDFVDRAMALVKAASGARTAPAANVTSHVPTGDGKAAELVRAVRAAYGPERG